MIKGDPTKKKSKKLLLQSEERFRLLYDSYPISIGTIDLSGNIIDANRAMVEMTGYTFEELRGMCVGDLYVDIKEHHQLFELLQQSDKVRDIEMQLKRKDGSLYYALVNIDKIEMAGGTLLLTTARDISCRKQAEEVLRKLNWSNELILTPADEGIFGLDREGKHTFVNPSASKMLGYEVRELIGKPGHTMWHHSKPDGSPYPEHESPIFMTIKDGIAHNVTGEVFWRKDSNLNNVIRETGLVPALLNRRSWPGKREARKTVKRYS